MSTLTDKILASGLIDKALTGILEQWGYLPSGSSDKVNETELVNASRTKLIDLAESLEQELTEAYKIKESALDLERLKWPVTVDIVTERDNSTVLVAGLIPAVVDRYGKYYFRVTDNKDSDFPLIPGNFIVSNVYKDGEYRKVRCTITDVTTLYNDDEPICIQVTTEKA